MASVSREPNGRRTIQFVGGDGKRRSLRLGKVSQHVAEAIKVKVEALNASVIAGSAFDTDVSKWLASIGDDLHAKLCAAGLAKPRARASACLQEFIDGYIAGRTDVKPETLVVLRKFADRLVAFFGADKRLADIKPADADNWLVYLKGEYAAATVARTVPAARCVRLDRQLNADCPEALFAGHGGRLPARCKIRCS